MHGNTTWLPPLILLDEYEGRWEPYLEAVYRAYRDDFISHRPYFDGAPVNRRRYPEVRGKEATFWHMVQEGPIEDDRTPDLRRFERIRWPKPIIEQGRRQVVKIWENRRGTQRCVCLWAEPDEYLVILARRSGYLILITAYPVIQEHRKRKLEREYRAYIASAAP